MVSKFERWRVGWDEILQLLESVREAEPSKNQGINWQQISTQLSTNNYKSSTKPNNLCERYRKATIIVSSLLPIFKFQPAVHQFTICQIQALKSATIEAKNQESSLFGPTGISIVDVINSIVVQLEKRDVKWDYQKVAYALETLKTSPL
jgi:hypothetical protein